MRMAHKRRWIVQFRDMYVIDMCLINVFVYECMYNIC